MRAFLMCSALVTACSRRSCVSSVFNRKFTCCFCSGANPAVDIGTVIAAGCIFLVLIRGAQRQTAFRRGAQRQTALRRGAQRQTADDEAYFSLSSH